MKKITVISDTHNNIEQIKSLHGIMLESDYVFHLGDYVNDIAFMRPELGEKLITVRGNGDLFNKAPDEKVVEIEGVKLFLTHGHKYRVKSTLQNLGQETLAYDCRAALYGHTHLSGIESYGGVQLINPGSFHAPKSGVNSYCYLIVWKGKVIPKIVEL